MSERAKSGRIVTSGDITDFRRCRIVVNCTGFENQSLTASWVRIPPPPQQQSFKKNYENFRLSSP